jgi:hypothetical protein
MKIYAKQVQPEYQEAPLFMEEWPENVYIFGNRHLCDNGAETIENIKNSMYDAADALKKLPRGYRHYTSFIDIINNLLPAPENKKEYSRADRLQWRALLLNFDAGTIDDDAITSALQLITGDEYNAATIRGCSQGDWNNIIYPAKYGREWLEHFETEYFNTGSEWIIDPDGDNISVYAHEWNNEGIKKELAAAVGVEPENIIMQAFSGWTKTAAYTEV